MSASNRTFSEHINRNAGRLGWAGAAVLSAAGLGLLAAKLTERRLFSPLFDDDTDDLLQGEEDWLRDLVECT